MLNSVDDATGKVFLKFTISENTLDVFENMQDYVKQNRISGKYVDKDNVYYAESKLTDFVGKIIRSGRWIKDSKKIRVKFFIQH